MRLIIRDAEPRSSLHRSVATRLMFDESFAGLSKPSDAVSGAPWMIER